MGRRADHTPEQLREMVLAAAREIVEAEGEPALTTRRVAKEIRYTSGTLYNIFRDRNDLILALNGMTLDELYAALTHAPRGGDVGDRLSKLARAYVAFGRKHPRRWSLVFEHRTGESEPEWYPPKVASLFALVEDAIAPLYGSSRSAERSNAARMLWASFHGMCALEAKGALAMSATTLVDLLIEHFLAGSPSATRKPRRAPASP